MGGWDSRMSNKTQDGDTALSLAAVQGRTECVRLLVECGADKEAKNNVRVQLLIAFWFWFFTHVHYASTSTGCESI